MNKVRHGTPVHEGPALCRTCRHARVIAGTSLNDEVIICGELPTPYSRITFKVTECSEYKNRAVPTLGAMQEIAWQLRTDRDGRRVGFMSPDDFEKRREEIRVLPYLDESDIRRGRS
jgi:hypothetical protein